MALYFPAGFVPDFAAATQPQYSDLRVDENGALVVSGIIGEGGTGLTTGQAEDLANIDTSTAAMAAALADTSASATAAEVSKRTVAGVATETKFAKFGTSSSGNTSVVAAVTGKKIRVLSLTMMAGGTTAVKFTDGAGGTDLTGAFPLIAQAGLSASHLNGLFETTAATALVLNNGSAQSIQGMLTYVEL